MDIGFRAALVKNSRSASGGLIAPKPLRGQPRAYILFSSRIYLAKCFIRLELFPSPANNGGGILRALTVGYAVVKEVAPSDRIVRFGAFEVDFRNGDVRKYGLRIRLQSQPFHVLQVLLERPGELVTREELQRQIWPADTFVDFEKGLNNAIKRLRDALGDSADQPRYIETHSRRGYRFIGSVTATNGAGRAVEKASMGEAVVPRRSRPRYRRLAAGAALFLAFVATLFWLGVGGVKDRWLIRPSSPVIHSLAVLPLTNLSNDPNQEYFADGMTDALITDLAQIASLKVISRTSVMRYKKSSQPLPEIASELNVDGIVEGTVQRSGDRVRITAQLIHGSSDKHLWANSFEVDARDVFALERNITREIARRVQARITTPNIEQGDASKPVDLKVLEAYLQGNYYLTRGSGDGDMKEAQKYFQAAIDNDPKFVPAYVGMTYSHYLLLFSSKTDRAIRRASAQKATALAPDSSDAHSALGEMMLADWDWAGAEEELRHAIALNPNNAKAHNAMCKFLNVNNRLAESLSECQTAQELDPDHDHLSELFEASRQIDRAIEALLRESSTHPNDGFLHYYLFRDYGLNGKYQESIDELERSLNLVGYSESAAKVHRALIASGYQGALREWAKELERIQANHGAFLPRLAAEIYAQLGDKDRAFYWLEQAYENHDRIGNYGGLEWVTVSHELDPLRSDARYKNLLRRIGLPP